MGTEDGDGVLCVPPRITHIRVKQGFKVGPDSVRWASSSLVHCPGPGGPGPGQAILAPALATGAESHPNNEARSLCFPPPLPLSLSHPLRSLSLPLPLSLLPANATSHCAGYGRHPRCQAVSRWYCGAVERS